MVGKYSSPSLSDRNISLPQVANGTAYRKSQMQGQICTRGKRKILDQKVSGSEDQRGGGD